jgi:hypothetical protein
MIYTVSDATATGKEKKSCFGEYQRKNKLFFDKKFFKKMSNRERLFGSWGVNALFILNVI